ncbi:MAG: heparinase II/III family protein [Planctomycetes bacterium]|nr:heparinase II/III family protein [Planctomycetota bacterium]
MDQQQWKGLSGLLADPFFAQLHAKVLACLEEPLEKLRFEPAWRYPYHRVYKNIIQLSCVAWHTTGQERYLQLAVESLRKICGLDWGPDPVRPESSGIRGADLRTAELMYTTAFGLDALHDDLSVDDRRMCVESLVNNGLVRYLKGIELNDWWVRCNFNWNSMQHGNAGIAALAVRRHAPAVAEKAIAEAKKGLVYMTGAFYEGGGWTEGVMYFGTALGHLTDFAFALRRATGEDCGVLADKKMHDTIDFAICMQGGDGRGINFSNMFEGRGGWALSQVFWYARMLNRPDWTADLEEKILARGMEMRGLFTSVDSFWYRQPFQPSQKAPARKGLIHFKGIDWAVWRGDRSWCAFRGGFNGGNHNNHDLGHFIFGMDKTRFLIDPGYGMARADMHNTPLIRFEDQTDCATAPIIRCDSLPGGFYIVCDLREAFPFALEHFDRHLAMLDDRYLFLVDDVKGRGDIRNDVQENLQTRFPVQITEEGFAISGDGAVLRVCLGGDVGGRKIETWEGRQLRWEKQETRINRVLWYDSYFRVHSVQPALLTTDYAAVSFQVKDADVSVSAGGLTCGITLRQAWPDGMPPACRIAK